MTHAPWIKMRTDLLDDSDVVGITHALTVRGLPRDAAPYAAIGLLYATWALADRVSADGVLQHYTTQDLDERLGFMGWASTLADAGWLVIGKGHLTIPEWEEHNGSSTKKRLQDSKRSEARRSRERKKSRTQRDKSHADSVTLSSSSSSSSSSSASVTSPKVKKEALPLWQTILETEATDLALDADLRDAWAEWTAYRKAHPKCSPWTAATIRGQIKKARKFGVAGWCAAVRYSIDGGHPGLYENQMQPDQAKATGLPRNASASERAHHDFVSVLQRDLARSEAREAGLDQSPAEGFLGLPVQNETPRIEGSK